MFHGFTCLYEALQRVTSPEAVTQGLRSRHDHLKEEQQQDQRLFSSLPNAPQRADPFSSPSREIVLSRWGCRWGLGCFFSPPSLCKAEGRSQEGERFLGCQPPPRLHSDILGKGRGKRRSGREQQKLLLLRKVQVSSFLFLHLSGGRAGHAPGAEHKLKHALWARPGARCHRVSHPEPRQRGE